MALIFTNQKSAKKQKKKPGWKEAEKQQQEWLNKINSVSLFNSNKPKLKSSLPSKMPKLKKQLDNAKKLNGNSVQVIGDAGCTKKVHRPEIMYKDDPEMLARELKARERKFAIAPAYNKGAAQLVTEDFMKDITAGTTRRR